MDSNESDTNAKIQNRVEFIELIEPNHLLISSESQLELSSTCGINKKFIPGKILVKYKNCTISINEISYPNVNFELWDNIKMIPNLFTSLNASIEEADPSRLEYVSIKNREKIITDEGRSLHDTFFSYVPMALMITLTIAYIGIKIYKKYTRTPIQRPEPTFELITDQATAPTLELMMDQTQ